MPWSTIFIRSLKRLSLFITRVVGRGLTPLLSAAAAAGILLRDCCACAPRLLGFVVILIVVCRSRSMIDMALFCRLRTVFRLLSFVVGVLVVSVGSFNVDIHAPIVKRGVADSYFGFSVAQHLVFNHGRGFGDPV